jgi:Ca-activated chloride channel family protein
MNKKILFTTIIFLAVIAATGFSDSVIVSQVDNSSLLANQIIRVYVSVSDARGNPVPGLTRDRFRLFEGVPSKEVERPIIDFLSGANVNEGVNILFILDNSGSMYYDIAGRDTANPDIQRITYAKQAINDLLGKIKNPADRLGLISFNIRTDTDIALTDDKATIQKALMEIKKPAEGQGYTELYETLSYSVNKLRNVKGRKVIVLLSDGQNFPYIPAAGKSHPQFNERKGLPAAIEYAQREGISVFTIGLIEGASNPDLKKIASETGGVSYQVQDLRQLKDFYNQIRDRVLSEYLITCYAGMESADRKNVIVKLIQGTTVIDALPRSYYSATLFGKPQTQFAFWIFAFLLLALALLFLLFRLSAGKTSAQPSLEVLAVDGKKSRLGSMTIMEDKRSMTISGSESADLTITGDPKLSKTEVTLKKEGGDYTIVGSGGTVKVNNQPVTSRKLRSGDLITVGSTTIVFNGGIDVKTAKRSAGFAASRNKATNKIARRTGKHRR